MRIIVRSNLPTLCKEIDIPSEQHKHLRQAFSIGRDHACDLILDDRSISRRAILLVEKNSHWLLFNLGEFKKRFPSRELDEETFEKNHEVVTEGKTVVLPVCTIHFEIGEGRVGHTAEEQQQREDLEDQVVTAEETDLFGATDEGNEEEKKEEDEFSSFESDRTDVMGSLLESEEMNELGEMATFEEIDEHHEHREHHDLVEERTQILGTFLKYELHLFGEFIPYDRFILEKDEIIVGRDPDCDLVIDDPELSGKHAKFFRQGMLLGIEDLKSSNGTILNGKRVNKDFLQENDEIIIGSSSLTVHPVSELLEQEAGRLMPVANEQTMAIEGHQSSGLSGQLFSDSPKNEEEESKTTTKKSGKASLIGRLKSDPDLRKKVIYAVAAIALLFILFYDEKNLETGKENSGANTEKAVTPSTKGAEGSQEGNVPALTQEQVALLETSYQLATQMIESGKYREGLIEIDKIEQFDKSYKQTSSYKKVALEGLAKIEEINKKEKADLEKRLRKEKIKELVQKATDSVKERQLELSKNLFEQILKLDPENQEVISLREEIESWRREQERVEIEKAQKEAERKRMVDLLSPGKEAYLKGDWFLAIKKLELFFKEKGMDQDLLEEAGTMLKDSKNKMTSLIGPLMGKAQSFEESLDLKAAYSTYAEILKIDPTHSTALNKINEIKESLRVKSQRIYREALISESLSLFQDAKEKFREVKQVSPPDSEYYVKAEEKLKKYYEQ